MHIANYGSLAYHKHNGHLICEHKLAITQALSHSSETCVGSHSEAINADCCTENIFLEPISVPF